VACAVAAVVGGRLGSREGAAGLRAPAELGEAGEWAAPNGDLQGTRAATGSNIDSGSVRGLARRWRFRIPEQTTYSGLLAATPLAFGGRVYVQTLNSNVYALDANTGSIAWRRIFGRQSGGPNGLAVADGRLFGNTDTSAFALDRDTGRLLWSRRLTSPRQPIDVAPAAAGGLVFTSSRGLHAGGRGVLYALDAEDGSVRWRFAAVRDPWANPKVAAGGGVWWTPTIDDEGRLYAGTANPLPWGGTRAEPNGGSYRGAALYTDSLVVLDGDTGALEWYDQVTPHDVRDYDFALPPILVRTRVDGRERNVVVGAGKAGRVIAWDRETQARLWTTSVGRHLNDTGPLPQKPVTVCPGLFGGVLTPMAYAQETVYVAVIDLCMRGSASGYDRFFSLDYSKGRGEVTAIDVTTGRVRWRRPLASPPFGCATAVNDVLFTATFDGTVLALAADDGRVLWRASAPAGINACPAIAGDLLLVSAGAEPPGIPTPEPVVDAYILSGRPGAG
jgi:outer membrane protein assembly factor BamB